MELGKDGGTPRGDPPSVRTRCCAVSVSGYYGSGVPDWFVPGSVQEQGSSTVLLLQM
jgi:hypothetical protein